MVLLIDWYAYRLPVQSALFDGEQYTTLLFLSG